ncbi:hypothetical protein FRB90_007437 [Tulasnella sp. 427]|nr:hypothetical protein FRB90_007437 [Tulasnella sp. 427]
MAFNRLPTEMVFTIFEIVLALDRIHDPELPLEEIDQHRKSLFNIRNVSTAWNTLLLSSPRVWCAINVSSSQWLVQEVLDRARQTPLCLYSRWVRTGTPFYRSRDSGSTLSDRGDQIRTIRFQEEATYIYMLAMLLIREGTPNLRTLDLTKAIAWHLTDAESVSEQLDLALPNLRYLTGKGWHPLSGASWLQNLKSLTLTPPLSFTPKVMAMLSACSSLLQLSIHVDDCVDVEGLPCIDSRTFTWRSKSPNMRSKLFYNFAFQTVATVV